MKYITKKESNKVEKLTRQLSVLLRNLSQKYYDEDDFGPTANLYAKDHKQLQKLQDEVTWWVD